MDSHPLHDWQAWQLPFATEPELLAELGKGRTNRNYLVRADGRLWVLRINAVNSRELGIDREREQEILLQASAAGLSPELLFCSVEHGVLITAFIKGRHWHTGELSEPGKRAMLQEGLASLHSIAVSTDSFNYRQHAENYWQRLLAEDKPVPETLHLQRETVLSFIDEIPASKTLCHHDPNPQNIIEAQGRLYFLDWEYAAPGWVAFDFAALSVEWNISIDSLSLPSHIDTEELAMARTLYNYLCALWEAVQAQRS